jgi:hypothetical protein
VRNPKVGYCQSLNFIGATALLFLPEPSAFWLLAAMAENLLQVYHTRQMTMLQVDVRVLQQLVEEKVRGGVFFFGGEFEIGSMLHTHTHSSQEFCLYLRGLISEFVCAFFFFFFFFFFFAADSDARRTPAGQRSRAEPCVHAVVPDSVYDGSADRIVPAGVGRAVFRGRQDHVPRRDLDPQD